MLREQDNLWFWSIGGLLTFRLNKKLLGTGGEPLHMDLYVYIYMLINQLQKTRVRPSLNK